MRLDTHMTQEGAKNSVPFRYLLYRYYKIAQLNFLENATFP
jgi:hypothetical protein